MARRRHRKLSARPSLEQPPFFRRIWQQHQVFRFLFIGGFNTLLGYALYAVGIFAGLNYQLANFISLALCVLVGFKLQGKVVFRNADHQLFWRYVLFWMVLYRLNILLIGYIISRGFDAYMAGAIAIVPMTTLSFFIQKIIVFKPQKQG